MSLGGYTLSSIFGYVAPSGDGSADVENLRASYSPFKENQNTEKSVSNSATALAEAAEAGGGTDEQKKRRNVTDALLEAAPPLMSPLEDVAGTAEEMPTPMQASGEEVHDVEFP